MNNTSPQQTASDRFLCSTFKRRCHTLKFNNGLSCRVSVASFYCTAPTDRLSIGERITSYCFICSSWTCITGTPMVSFCSKGNLLSLQRSANTYVLYLCPNMLLRLVLWFHNAMIIARHVGHFTGERMIGSFVLTCALSSSPLKYILHKIIMIWSVGGDGWGVTLN